MFEIVRQDLECYVRVNQTGSRNLSACLRELFNPGTQAILIHHFGVWSDGMRFAPLRYLPGRVVRKLSAKRKLAKVGTGPVAESVSSPSLAAF